MWPWRHGVVRKSAGREVIPVQVRSSAPLTLNERNESNVSEVECFLTTIKEVRKMSRSYKSTPRSGDTKDKFFKKYANRKFRRLPLDEHPIQHKSYKKYFCSYDICDYETVGMTFEQYWEGLVASWHQWRKYYGYSFPNRDNAYKDYCRWFLRK